MNIDKYKKDKWYVDPIHGCHYDSAESYIASHILNFCGCGDIDAALKYVMGALEVVNIYIKGDLVDYQIACKEYFKNDGAMYHMWYFLDKQNLTEHGSSVPGWLTELGKEVLDDLKELYKDELPKSNT